MVCVLIEDRTSAANKNKYFISIKHKTVQEQPISIQENTLAYFPISLNLCKVITEYNMTEKLGSYMESVLGFPTFSNLPTHLKIHEV